MAQEVRNDTIVSQSGLAVSYTSPGLNLDAIDTLAMQAIYTDATPAAVVVASTAVNTTTHAITATAHGLFTGVVLQATTTGTLPTGLSTSTNYYVIVVDANTFKLATSLANAVAGTAIAISAQGSGNDTFTPTALSTTGAVVKLQCSNDNVNWFDISGKTVTVTAAGNTLWDLGTPGYQFVRVVNTPTTGAINLTVVLNGKLAK